MAYIYWPIAIGPAGPAGPPGSAGPPGPPGPPGPGGGGGFFMGALFGQNYNPGQTQWVSITNSGFGSAASSNPDDQNVTPVPMTGTIQGLYVTASDVGGSAPQPPSGSLTITVTLNGIDTALVLTIPPNSTSGIYSETVTSFAVNAGDYIGLKIHNNAANASISLCDMVLGIS